MIYTTYFAKLKDLPDYIIPISICGKAPDWYKGLQYKKLAPKYDFFMKWKKNHLIATMRGYALYVIKYLYQVHIIYIKLRMLLT